MKIILNRTDFERLLHINFKRNLNHVNGPIHFSTGKNLHFYREIDEYLFGESQHVTTYRCNLYWLFPEISFPVKINTPLIEIKPIDFHKYTLTFIT